MPMADWIEKYPRVKALLQDEDEVLHYRADDAQAFGEDAGPSPLRRLSADFCRAQAEEPWPLYETYWPPMDLSPLLPLTWAMVQAAWPQLVTRRA